MRIVLLGCPGAGKGTQAQKISKHLNIPKIATGDMLRAAVSCGSQLGKKVKDIMDSGQLVADEIMIELIKNRISESDCCYGFLLDGFPRTIAQAQALQNHNIFIDVVLEIEVDDTIAIERITGRRIHEASGRIYHTKYNPPIILDIDDMTGDCLVQRDDDKEETVKKRIKVYKENTYPLIEYYKKLSKEKGSEKACFYHINGEQNVDDVTNKIFSVLT